MSETQTHCSHRFIITTASAGTTGCRKRVKWRRGVERGQDKRDEGREKRQIGYYSWPKSGQKLLFEFVRPRKQIKPRTLIFPLYGTVDISWLKTVTKALCSTYSASTTIQIGQMIIIIIRADLGWNWFYSRAATGNFYLNCCIGEKVNNSSATWSYLAIGS